MGVKQTRPLQLWAGIESTVNRVQGRYFDQITRSGHADRSSDLARFAGLGICKVRYPVLWECTSNAAVDHFNWKWADERLAILKSLEIEPIVGLVHHGGGPEGTSLVERSFSEGLARYAGAVASRYPWVRDYTPVNEPLTTARFSALYGHWYPHARDPLSFAWALIEQCRGTVLAMRAIREIRPDARLIQTEDLGKTHSTPELAYQAAFENERRWLTWDLLSGRVKPGHAMWSYLTWAGVQDSELSWFLDNPCPPDVIGVNHYLTSERFLDHRSANYPAHTIGGNGMHTYADVEALRVLEDGAAGFEPLLKEVCERYDVPVAVTEVHNGCTREEQLRWLMEAWTAAERVRARGAPIEAVTAWALLGSYDWDSLVTLDRGHYEPGVFDLRAPEPRPTALAKLMRELASGKQPDHPLLEAPGWWRRPERLIFGFCHSSAPRGRRNIRRARVESINAKPQRSAAKPVLITGKTGTLGRAFARLCDQRGIPYRLLGRDELDIADPQSVTEAFRRVDPWAVINTAGYVRVDEAEHDRDRCFRENTAGPELLARYCAQGGIQFVTISSDLVFDGRNRTPYVESDRVGPLNVYGESKVEAENRVLGAMPGSLVIRTSAFFGPWDEYNFVVGALRDLAAGLRVRAAADVISPTYVPDLVTAALDLMIDEEAGIWHLANQGCTTWMGLAKRAAELAGLDVSTIVPASARRLGWIARRPHFSALSSERGQIMPPLEHALDRYFRDCTIAWRSSELAVSGAS
jgi:dTDP-4-dehydrorhamnose reductase